MFKKQNTPNDATPSSLRPETSSETMFNPSRDTATKSIAGATSQASIGPSIKIKGDITGGEDLTIHGQITGSISLPDNILTIGKQGNVDADMNAKSVDVEGQVSGTVRADEMVRVKPSGRVNGDISAPRVVLEDGCQFRGGIDMQVQTAQKTPSPKHQESAVKIQPKPNNPNMPLTSMSKN